MGIGGVYGKRDRRTRFRVSKNEDRCEELLGEDKGGVKLVSPQERLAWTLEGIGERSKDLGGVLEKSPVKNNHTEKTLQSRFISRVNYLRSGPSFSGMCSWRSIDQKVSVGTRTSQME